MAIESKSNILNKCMKGISVFFYGMLLLVLLFVLIGQFIFPDERDRTSTECQVFDTQWQQILENGDRIDVCVPGKIPAKWGEKVSIVTTLPEKVYSSETICFRSIWQDVEVYIDGELRQSYSTKNSRPFGKNSAFRCIFVELEESDAGKEMIYQFTSESKYAGTMKKVYIGDRSSIWFYLMGVYGVRAIVSLFLLMLSFFCIIICLVYFIAYKKILPLSYLIWTLFLCALWMMSEIEFRQVIFRNISSLSNVTYWCLMLLPIPMSLYMNSIQKKRYEKLYSLVTIYAVVVFVVGTLLQVFDVVQFVQQLPFVHVGLIFAIICIVATIIMDICKRHIKDYFAVGLGICGMLVSAIFEMAFYYINMNITLGTFLVVGLLFLLAMAIIKTGQDLLDIEKEKQKAIMAKDAQTKFLANMSHEIRTPINAVIGMNEMILRENEDETIRGYAENIQSASNMLLELINDILDMSKIESGELELVENTYYLASLIKDEQLLLTARVGGKAISTKVEVDSEIPAKLYGDELRIKQILTNLLSNAVKYTKQGSVTLKVYSKWIEKDTIMLSFSVKDTGIGIRKEDIPNMFDKFKRLELSRNRNVEGTGLGLNIVKQLVEQMHGKIKVESEYGKGSEFTISIPQKVMDKNPIGDMQQSIRESRAENRTSEKLFTAPDAIILAVDDNAMNLTLMKALLKRTKIQIDTATGGKACLELTKQKKYDMILMDHMMPELDGIETLKLLKADSDNINKDTVVIALTANAVEGSREMYLEYGFNDYFSKPIQADKLDELLIQYLPENLVHMEKKETEAAEETDTAEDDLNPVSQEISSELLAIDRTVGLSYCLNSEEIYKEVLTEFCTQVETYLPQLETALNEKNWAEYAIITHALKGNSLNIGASEFSKLSLEHELAGKEENTAFIYSKYGVYRAALIKLAEEVKAMI